MRTSGLRLLSFTDSIGGRSRGMDSRVVDGPPFRADLSDSDGSPVRPRGNSRAEFSGRARSASHASGSKERGIQHRKGIHLLEEQEEGILFADPQLVYSDPGEWEVIRAQLAGVRLRDLAQATGISERRLRESRQGARVPSGSQAAPLRGDLVSRIGVARTSDDVASQC